jgi:glycerophosphoryl diester phosphodiesterase
MRMRVAVAAVGYLHWGMGLGRHVLWLAFAMLLAMPGAAFAQLVTENPWLEGRPLNIAHQGGEIEAPSDTLYAFKTAKRKGADVIETDVHLTADGRVVVLHDETVDRTTNGSGSVEQMTLDQVKRLDAAYWFIEGEGTVHDASRPARDFTWRGVATGERPPPERFEPNDFKIPTLDEVLAAFPHTRLNIELKPTTIMSGRLESAVAALLARHGRSDDVIVASFNDSQVELFKALAPEVHTAPGTGQVAAFWASSQGPGTGTPNPQHVALQVPETFNGLTVVSPDFIADAHANNLAVHVWTVNDADDMRRLLDWGVNGIMTDRPTLLERVLAAFERKKPKRNR